MSKYKLIYTKFLKYGEQDFIPCEICGRHATGGIHHIIYRSQGGEDVITNLMATCFECHEKLHFRREPYIHREKALEIHLNFLNNK
jgi:hypothetical protein